MRFFVAMFFVLFFSLKGIAQQQQNQLKKPDAVQPSRGVKGNHAPSAVGQKQMMDFNKPVPAKNTVKPVVAKEQNPARKLAPLDPNKVVRKQ